MIRESEADFQAWVMDVARLHGWQVSHTRPAWSAKGYRTPVQGDRGAPDLLLAKAGRVLLAELKSRSGRPSAEQLRWLDALGPHGRLWRPSDRAAILAELRAESRSPVPGVHSPAPAPSDAAAKQPGPNAGPS